MHLLNKTLKSIASIVLVLVLLFEEWGWEPLSRLASRLARLPLWAALERQIGRLPPYWALLLFALPVGLLFPIKIAALWLLQHGYHLQGMAVFVAAKVFGTALVARLFQLTQPALMQIAWFAHWYPRWTAWKSAWFARIRASRPWRLSQIFKHRSQRWWQRWSAN